jgi:hypothetical protein
MHIGLIRSSKSLCRSFQDTSIQTGLLSERGIIAHFVAPVLSKNNTQPRHAVARHHGTAEVVFIDLRNEVTQSRAESPLFRKRDVFVAAFLPANFTLCLASQGIEVESLVEFVDSKKRFRLAYPREWNVLGKAGADLMIQDPADKYSHVGVTVSPVKISSLSEFGSVHEIGLKLSRAEAAKGSTIPGGFVLLSERQRRGHDSATTFYDYEYSLTTTRGKKRVFNSVTVVENVLYIFNAQFKEDVVDLGVGVSANKNILYDGIVSSFDVL